MTFIVPDADSSEPLDAQDIASSDLHYRLQAKTLFHWVSYYGSNKYSLDILKERQLTDLDTPDDKGRTSVHSVFLRMGNLDEVRKFVEILVNDSADFTKVDHEGLTCLALLEKITIENAKELRVILGVDAAPVLSPMLNRIKSASVSESEKLSEDLKQQPENRPVAIMRNF